MPEWREVELTFPLDFPNIFNLYSDIIFQLKQFAETFHIE